MKGDVGVFGRDLAEKELIAVIVPENGVNGAGKALRDGGERKGRAKVTEKQKAFGAVLVGEGEGASR